MALFDGLLDILAWKKRPSQGGTANTPTYSPLTASRVLSTPQYLDHLSDIFTSRVASDSLTLMKSLFVNDPDVSSTVNGYLTLANTEMITYAIDINGQVDPQASLDLENLIKRLTRQVDYTQGFQFKQNIYQLNADLRYMLLLRGGIATELVFDKSQNPDRIKTIDLATIRWYETKPGEYKPSQLVSGQSQPVMLDAPNIFVSFYRRDPTTIYTQSPFVSSINTIAARQQVINDLYRIMQFTGYPRMEVTVVEKVIRESAPANLRVNEDELRQYVAARMAEISTTFSAMRPDQAVVHSDSIELKMLNEKSPGVGIDITNVIETLNAQNQAALKTMATILGRGSAGVNTSSVEARLAALFADELNEPLAEFYEKIFSFCLHQQGYQGFAVVKFRPAELRPQTELEPQLTLKAARLRQDLSDGIISDVEYHLEMYGRLPPPEAPALSGTGFVSVGGMTGAAADVSANTDPLGRSVSPDASAGQIKANPKKSKTPRKS